ncbi:phosphate/phosphite/phosphonate ABC transporter substrate-binding protein [Chitinimonas naiadis]
MKSGKWLGLAAWGAGLLALGMTTSVQAADKTPLCLAVAEGSSGQADVTAVRDKYRGLADELAQAVGRPVKVRVLNFNVLLQTIKQGECEIVYTRTSYIAGWAIRDQQYSLLAANEGSKEVVFISRGGDRYASVKDLRGKRVAMPEPQSDLTMVANAMLRDAGMKPADLQVQSTNLQEAIIFGVDNQLSDVGVLTSNSKAAKDWAKKGGAVGVKSRTLPNWAFLGAPSLRGEEAERVRGALLGLAKSDSGKKALQDANLSPLIPARPADYLAVVTWVGPPV